MFTPFVRIVHTTMIQEVIGRHDFLPRLDDEKRGQ